MTDMTDKNLLWDFSIQTYAKAHIEDSLLLLQDRHELDVNLVLLCCWLGGRGIRLKDVSMQRLIDESQQWRDEVVKPLRHLRRSMKRQFDEIGGFSCESVRSRVKEAELAAEKFQQDFLYKMLDSLPGLDAREADRAGLMRINMLTLIRVAKCSTERDVIRPLIERLIIASCQVMEISDEYGPD